MIRSVMTAGLCLATGFAVLAAPSEAEAQMLEEIVVTARKRSETLQDAPLAVSAVSGEKMDDQGVTTLEQITATVPGLQIGRGAQTSNIAIRGVGSGINKGFEQSVGMYIDGIYQPRSRQFTQALVDVERVEVLRGPQGLLFGKNTVAGAIKMESRNALVGDEFAATLSAGFEPEFGTQRYTGIVSGSLSDTVAARLVLRSATTDGYVSNELRNKDELERDDTLARLSVTWEPSDNFSLVGKLSHVEMEGKGSELTITTADYSLIPAYAGSGRVSSVLGSIALSAGLVPFEVSDGGASYDSYNGNPTWVPGGNIEDTESTNASLKMEWDVGTVTLSSVTGYTEFEFFQFHDVDFGPANIIQNTDDEDLELFSQEFRIATNWDNGINLIAGVYYEQQDFYGDSFTQIDATLGGLALPLTGSPTLFPPITEATRYHFFDQEAETLAFFAEVTFDITDHLRLEVGARYSQDDKDLNKRAAVGTGVPGAANLLVFPEDTAGSADFPAYLANAAAAGGAEGATAAAVMAGALKTFVTDTSLDRDENHFDPSVKLLGDYSDTGLLYLSYSEGYKSGGFNYSPTTAAPSGLPTNDAVFEDEEVDAWELGIKQEFLDGRARASLALYRSELENLQVTSWNGTNFVVGNAAELQVQGVEVEGQILVTDSLELGLNFSYLDHEFESYPGAPCTVVQMATDAACLNDFEGKRGAYAPEYSGALFLDFTHQFNDWELNAHVDLNYKDDFFLDGDLDANALQDSYVKVNASMHLLSQDGTWKFTLYGRNLTDETTYTASVDAPLSAGVYVAWIEEPRVIGAEVTFSF